MMNNYILYADIIRVFATIQVVFLHTSAPLMYNFNTINLDWWWTGNIIDSATRPCVPLFFMLSGMLLLGREEPLSLFLKKRLGKIVIPFLTWALIYLFMFNDKKSVPAVDLGISLFIKFINGPVYYHYWFMYMIILLYLITPFLRVYVSNAPSKNIEYFLFLWFLFSSLNPLLNKFLHFYIFGLKVDLLAGYLGYFILGHYLHSYNLRIKNNRHIWVLISIILITILITSLGTYFITKNNDGKLDTFFYGYLSPNIIIMSISIFMVFKNICSNTLLNKFTKLFRIIKYISSASFGIYLLHPLILYWIKKVNISATTLYHPAIGIPGTAIVAIAACFIIVFVLQKVPYLKHIVP